MKVISRGSELEINGQVMKVEDVLATLKDLPSKEIVAFFNEQGMNMPRKVRMTALHKVIDKRVKKAEYKSQFTDEVRYRLRWLNTFSEHQLEGILTLISNAEIYNEYRETLWLMFIKLHEELKIETEKLTGLFETARGYKMSQKESIAEYQRGMDSLFYDERNEVDGLEYNTFREVLAKSSTLNELREIGAKYNIDVPRRIKKEELADIIIDACSASGKFSPEEQEKVKRMSVQQLQRYAKQNGVKASIELKKEDIIEYIINRVETEVQKSYVNLAVLDIPTEDDEIIEDEEEIVEDQEIVEEAPAEEAPQSNAQIEELKAMILNLQMQMNNKDKSEEEKAELAKQAEEAQAKADAAEEALKAQQEAHEQELAEVKDQAEAEKQQALADAEAERLAQEEAAAEEEARIAEEEKAAEEARLAEEAAAEEEAQKQAEMDALKEENETLKEQMANMQESKDLEEDEFVVPLFDYEEEQPEEATEETTEEVVEEEPVVEEVVEEEQPEEEVVEEEEGLIRLEDTENQELNMIDETETEEEDEDTVKIEDFEDIAMPDIEEEPTESYQAADQPSETKVEEAPAETQFDSPSYDDSDEYGSFDTPLFDTPIFEAPVFEAPMYGEDKAARERRLGNESKMDKKKKAAEEKAIKEALQADSKVARRKKKSNPVVTILKWVLIILVILLVLVIILGILGLLGVLEGTPLQGLYEGVRDVIHKILGDGLYESIAKTIKGWFGK
ncbi:MAG: cell envelope integrity protein TolA [bacterium]|nr:cell envelope integrity protein TolA [bacterium]